MDKEIADLEATFRVIYRYQTQIFRIPSVKPEQAVLREILSLLNEPDRQKVLHIVYYAGHAIGSGGSTVLVS